MRQLRRYAFCRTNVPPDLTPAEHYAGVSNLLLYERFLLTETVQMMKYSQLKKMRHDASSTSHGQNRQSFYCAGKMDRAKMLMNRPDGEAIGKEESRSPTWLKITKARIS
jgi:hypothetical protein